MKKRLLAWSLVALTLAPVAAEQIYVRNHPFKGGATRADGKIWIELKPLAEALGITLKQTAGGGFIIQTSGATDEEDLAAGHVKIDGQEVETKDNSGLLLVPLDSTVKMLGARAVHNKDLGSIDISLARTAAPGGTTTGSKTGTPPAVKAQTGPMIIALNAKSPGSAIDVPSSLVPGRMNIVEFGASW